MCICISEVTWVALISHFGTWIVCGSVCVFHGVYCWSVRRCWRLMFMWTPGEDEVSLVVTHTWTTPYVFSLEVFIHLRGQKC